MVPLKDVDRDVRLEYGIEVEGDDVVSSVDERLTPPSQTREEVQYL